MNFIEMLQGKKTYLITAISVALAIMLYLTDQADLQTTIYAVFAALGFSTVRAGSKADAKAVVDSRPSSDPAKIP